MFQVLALLFGNKSQSKLHCYFLKLLNDFGVAGEYSWGSATLVFLYKELCTAAIQKSTEIAGPVFILKLWAWEHLPYLTQIPINLTNLNGDDPYGCRYNIYFLFLYNIVYCSVYSWYFQTLNIVWQSLLVYRWDTKRMFTHTPTHVLRAYHSNHDTYNNQQVIYHNVSMVNLLVILLSWLIIT